MRKTAEPKPENLNQKREEKPPECKRNAAKWKKERKGRKASQGKGYKPKKVIVENFLGLQGQEAGFEKDLIIDYGLFVAFDILFPNR
jgi:hypothetical protein